MNLPHQANERGARKPPTTRGAKRGGGSRNTHTSDAQLQMVLPQRDNADTHASEAIISINTIDILNPPLPLKFGAYNNRDLDEDKAKELLAMMKAQDFRQYRPESMIPLFLTLDDIEPGAIYEHNRNYLDAPLLKLTDKGMTRTAIVAAGGRHRRHAVLMEVEARKKEIEQYDATLKNFENKAAATGQAQERQNKEIEATRECIKKLQEYIRMISHWGVVIYNEGQCLNLDAHFSMLTLPCSRSIGEQGRVSLPLVAE
jgi:hypothetical protein